MRPLGPRAFPELDRRAKGSAAETTSDVQARWMIDYYAILSRAADARETNDAAWRRNVYDRARRTLASQMRARRPQPEQAEIARELAELEAAVRRIEAERGGSDQAENSAAVAAEPDQSPLLDPWWSRRPVWIAFTVVVAALCAGAYVFWSGHRAAGLASRAPANGDRVRASAVAMTKDGDVTPGIDGGPMDADQSYVFRRQPTFYRTLQPVGTVIIDKSQHFLYLIRPNSVALRYGIGIGGQCADLVGLRHVASMAEWQPWEASPDMVKQKLAQSGTLVGGPGNPLGARVLVLDDNTSRVHGTNAPKTIGANLAFGCIRLVNDDIVDLYGRVQVGTPVLVN
jgi:lipoprotein-anchoring transpeptidase ErfK/SrfK